MRRKTIEYLRKAKEEIKNSRLLEDKKIIEESRLINQQIKQIERQILENAQIATKVQFDKKGEKISTYWTNINKKPGCMWMFWHISCIGCIGCLFLMAWSLLNMKRPVAKFFVFVLKISIAFSTCLSKSSAENHTSQFVPALNTMHASLTNTINITHHRSKKNSLFTVNEPAPFNVNMSEIISDGPSPFFCGITFWLGWVHSVLLQSFA